MPQTGEDKHPSLLFFFFFLIIYHKFIKQWGFFLSFFFFLSNKPGNENTNLNSNFPPVLSWNWLWMNRFLVFTCKFSSHPSLLQTVLKHLPASWPLLYPNLWFPEMTPVYSAMTPTPSAPKPIHKRYIAARNCGKTHRYHTASGQGEWQPLQAKGI